MTNLAEKIRRRAGFGRESYDRLAGLQSVHRTLGFLGLALSDYVRSSAAFRDDFDRQREHFGERSGMLTEAEVAWGRAGALLSEEVQFRIETYYFFARRLLDEVVSMLGDALGRSKTELGRHKALETNLPEYASELGLEPPPDELLDLWREATERVARFRDQQVAHPREPRRRFHGVSWTKDQRPRLSIGAVYPRDKDDVGVESEALHDLARLLDSYVAAVLDYIESNLGKVLPPH